MSDKRKDHRNARDEDVSPKKRRKMRVLQDDDNYGERFEKTKKIKNFDLDELYDD